MAESKKIVMVGIPGVGKTTLVAAIASKLNQNNHSVSVHSFGTIMFEQARSHGVSDRDQLRKLSISEQQNYQREAAQKIAEIADEIVIVDTHAFISTPSGFSPGLPEYVLKIIKPAILISVYARPEEIFSRRLKDETRNRDKITVDRIKKELSLQESIVSTCSVLSGAPIKTILNSEGKVDDAVEGIIRAIGV